MRCPLHETGGEGGLASALGVIQHRIYDLQIKQSVNISKVRPLTQSKRWNYLTLPMIGAIRLLCVEGFLWVQGLIVYM